MPGSTVWAQSGSAAIQPPALWLKRHKKAWVGGPELR